MSLTMEPSAEAAFRRLTIGDTALISAMADPDGRVQSVRHLDSRTEALVQVGVLVAIDAPPSSFRTAIDAALMSGADVEDLLAVLAAVAGSVGSARVISAAPRIALAAGYDVEAALERLQPVETDDESGGFVRPHGGRGADTPPR